MSAPSDDTKTPGGKPKKITPAMRKLGIQVLEAHLKQNKHDSTSAPIDANVDSPSPSIDGNGLQPDGNVRNDRIRKLNLSKTNDSAPSPSIGGNGDSSAEQIGSHRWAPIEDHLGVGRPLRPETARKDKSELARLELYGDWKAKLFVAKMLADHPELSMEKT